MIQTQTAMSAEIIVVGAGSHARVLIDVLRRGGLRVKAAVDTDKSLHGREIEGVAVIGGDEAIYTQAPDSVILVAGVGNIPSVRASGLDVRHAVFERFEARGYSFRSVVSPDAIVSTSAVLGNGCQVITGAIIHPGAKIGIGAIINTGAIVDHDCAVGAYSHIAPGAVLCGNVTIGEEVHVGAGAVVIQGVQIGSRAVVGAGAVVTADIAEGAVVLGFRAQAPESKV